MTIEEFNIKYHYHFAPSCSSCKFFGGAHLIHDTCTCTGPDADMPVHIVIAHSICDLYVKDEEPFKAREVEDN